MEQGMDFSSKEARIPEIMSRLRDENDKFERLTTDLGNLLTPVMMSSPLAEAERPMEEPYHEYHNQILRYSRLNDQLANIIQSIKL